MKEKMKELLVYIYRLPISEGRPAIRWLNTSRWWYLKRESTPRFRSALGYLKKAGCPMIEYGKGYLVLKITPVKEKIIYIVPDLLFDVIITPTKIEGIWEQLWEINSVKPDDNLMAIWQIGENTSSTQKLKEVKVLYQKLLEELSKKGSDKDNKEGVKA
jgi:hypothetical protein